MKKVTLKILTIFLIMTALSGIAGNHGKIIIKTNDAPEAIGPYSQGVKLGNMIYTAGQIGIDPVTGRIESSTPEGQTEQVLKNLKAIIDAGGGNMSTVIKTTVYVKNLKDYKKINEVYATFFEKEYPARSCVEVAKLPKNALVEIEAIAYEEQK